MTDRRPLSFGIRAPLVLASLCAAGASARAQDPPAPQAEPHSEAQRIERLEQENVELHRRLDLVAEEVERSRLGALVPSVTEGEHGMGRAASKIYSVEQGVSIGGYGEALYENFQGSGKSDLIDLVRAVLYVGYKFDERWLFNSELEFEHASTGQDGEVSVEFAYLDRLVSRYLNFRAGLLLVPMGFLNELHEPTTFPSARRPGLERLILPTTWRESGAGMFGEAGDFSYRAYVLAGLDAAGFAAGGLRGGRQSGSESLAEDFAFTGRIDYAGAPGLVVGASAWWGDSGQDLAGPGGEIEVGTTIVDLHAEYRWRALRLRTLLARAELDDVADLDAALGLTGMQSVGEALEGGYVEVGYDVWAARNPGSRAALTPFVRWETYDTQADVPSGFASDPAHDVEITTVGVAYQPIDSIVIKLDAMDVENEAGTGVDQINVAFGFIF